jgi:NADP-dependent 3-hydroxy acid dehydrogenase YdfG
MSLMMWTRMAVASHAVETGLRGKRVLVTGASGGIGAACARAFAAEGCRVVVHYHQGRERAEALGAELGGAPVVGADLTDETAVDRLFEQAREAVGGLDVCAAVAGAWPEEDLPVWRLPLERWEATLRANLTATFLTARGFLREVERNGHGSLVLIGSTAALFGEAGHADYAAAVQRSRRVADRMAKGVEFLFRKNKITHFPGRGTLPSASVVEVAGAQGTRTLEAKAVILATGSEPRSLPGVAIDEQRVISSNGAVRNERAPASLVIIGAGAVGVEFADVYASYGVQVTLLEALARILPMEDEEVSAQLARLLGKRGIAIRTGVTVRSVKAAKGGVTVEVEVDGKAFVLELERIERARLVPDLHGGKGLR